MPARALPFVAMSFAVSCLASDPPPLSEAEAAQPPIRLAAAPASAVPNVGVAETPHVVAYRRLEAQFVRAMEKGPGAGLAFTEARIAAVSNLPPNSPERADANELKVQTLVVGERWGEAFPLIVEVVRVRRSARPPEPELLAGALVLEAIVRFALDQADDADAKLREALAQYSVAFGADDLRFARQLELNAEQVQKGFARPTLVMEMLGKAVTIREHDPTSSRPKLAETLVELGIHETNAGRFGDAVDHLARAATLLEPVVQSNAAAVEDAALLGQALVLRAGLLAKLARHDEADALLARAEAVKLPDRVSHIEQQLMVREARSTSMELRGNVDGAIDAERSIGTLLSRNTDLLASGAIDSRLVGDTSLALGQLQLEAGDLSGARASLAGASKILGDTAEVLFARAELERLSGNGAGALKLAREALALRKQSAAEMTVLFGTNREVERSRGQVLTGAAPVLSFGAAEVLVPGGAFSERSLLRPKVVPALPVGPATDASQLFIRSVVLDPDTTAWRNRVPPVAATAKLDRQAALIFVHGFNVSFDDAVRRAAQLTRDLNFDGPLFVFSWPSKGSMFRYGTDRDSADASAALLATFIGDVARATAPDTRINIVAHSMGNRVLLQALATVARNATLATRLGEVVFAAPAVPVAEFERAIDKIRESGHPPRMTLYASHVDRALQLGFWREGATALAGYSAGGAPLLHEGVDSIDVTNAASGDLVDLNHDVFASNPVMVEDMRQLFAPGPRKSPEERLPFLTRPDKATARWVYDTRSPSTLGTTITRASERSAGK